MRVITTVVMLAASAVVASADPFNSIVVLGDSLSDNGNVYSVSGHTIPQSPPYFNGRFSNGPVAVEDLAAFYSVPLIDLAYGGATTGLGDSGDGGSVAQRVLLPGMQSELASLTPAQLTALAPGSLFVVWGGTDDLSAPDPADTTPQQIANHAANNIIGIVNTLKSYGATQIVVPGIPDLALVPAYSSNPAVAAAARSFATTFNGDLTSGLPAGAIYVDTFDELDTIVANPAYGFTNVTSACLSSGTVCSNPNQYLFFDSNHPTAPGHALLAAQIESAIPEPSTAFLGFSALALFGAARKMRARA